MSELFAIFKHHLLWGLMLWMLLFVAFAAMFARGKVTPLTKGLMRLVVSIIVSPFVFLQRATSGVLGFDDQQEQSFRAGDQYVLSKAMMILQAVIIIVAIGALAAGVVATWNAFVPPSEVREAARRHRSELENQKLKAANDAAAVTKLDTDWASRQAGALAKYRSERQTRIRNLSGEMGEIETSLSTYGNENVKAILGQLKERAASRSTESADDLSYGKRALDNYISNQWYWLEDWSRTSLNRWNELWLARNIADLELRTLSIDELRRAEQPDYDSAVARSSAEAERLQEMTVIQANLDDAASLKWKAAGWRALAAFVTFLFFVWTAGLLIEAGWLGIRVAGDVRRLREAAEGRTGASAAPSEIRLPIREGASASPMQPAQA